jgi:hypothetical protein
LRPGGNIPRQIRDIEQTFPFGGKPRAGEHRS